MGAKSILDDVGRILTAKAILAFVLSTGAVVLIAVWLAYLTIFVRLFAPLSYLLVGLVALLFALAILAALIGIAKSLGWRPRHREPAGPKRDAGLKAVFYYIVNESAWGIGNFGGNFERLDVRAVEKEMMDRIGENDLAVWGRSGHMQTSRIDGNWDSCSLNFANGQVSMAGYMDVIHYQDIEFNWREIEKTWPRPPIWKRKPKWRITKGSTASGRAPAA